jgi:hypothetical protein
LAIGPKPPAGRPERTQRLPSGPYGVGPDQFGAAVGFGGTGSGAMSPSQNSPDDQHHEGSMAAGLMVAQINQPPFPALAHCCQGREAVGTGRWFNGLHGRRSRSRSGPRSWPGAIWTVPAWMISAFCAAAWPLASGASWSPMVSRSGPGGTITAMAGRPSSCAAETGRVSMLRRIHCPISRRHHGRAISA